MISKILAVYLHKARTSVNNGRLDKNVGWLRGCTQGTNCLTTSYRIGSVGHERWVTVRTLNMSEDPSRG